MVDYASMSEPDATSPPQLRFQCFKCRATLRAPLRYAGRLASCPECGAANTVPRPGTVPEPEEDSFGVPPRAGHEKYLDVLEASAAQVREVSPAQPPRPMPTMDPGTRRLTWLLVAGNAVVAIAVLGLVLWIWKPWAAATDERTPSDDASVQPSVPATDPNDATRSEEQGF